MSIGSGIAAASAFAGAAWLQVMNQGGSALMLFFAGTVVCLEGVRLAYKTLYH